MIRKNIERILLGALLLFPVVDTDAAGTTATVSWTLPPTYTDNVSLPTADVKFATVTWSRSTGSSVGSITVAMPALTVQIPNLVCGNFNFVVSLTTTDTATYPNTTSDNSNLVPYATGIACKPNPPTATVQ